MAKKVAAGMKAVWEAAKRDIAENSHTELLKQDVIDVLEIAKNIKAKRSPSSDFKSSTMSIDSSKVEAQINQDAGADLLSHFKDEWAEIHLSTEEASRVATQVDTELGSLNQSINRSHVIINKCREEFSRLKEVLEALDEAHSKVDAIGELMRQVEEDVHNYCLAKADLENERRKHSLLKQHNREIAENESKVVQLQRVLRNEHKLTLDLQHEIESEELKERQSAFQEIFDKQMSDYRHRGEVNRPINKISESHFEQSLEEVVIEDKDGTASLHEFLSDVVLDNAPTDPEEEEEEEEEEEALQDTSSNL